MKMLLILFLSLTYGLSAMRDFNEYYKELQSRCIATCHPRNRWEAGHDVYKDALRPYFGALHSAIEKNEVQEVKALLKKEPFITYYYELKTPNFLCVPSESVIQHSFKKKKKEILKAVLSAGRCSVNDDNFSVLVNGSRWEENYLLHESLRREYFDIARMLLNARDVGYDADVNIAGWSSLRRQKETPLIIALHKYNKWKLSTHDKREQRLAEWIEIIKIILNHDAQIVFATLYWDNPFYYCQNNDLPEITGLFNPHLNRLYEIIKLENRSGHSTCHGRQESKEVLRTLMNQGLVVRCDDGTFLMNKPQSEYLFDDSDGSGSE